jgi:putative flippase GtrA
MILVNQQERHRFYRFACVGIIGAIVDFGTFNIFVSVLRLPALWSSVISFAAAVMSNFLWNRFWTYPDSRSKSVVHQILQFSLVSVIGLSIRTYLFALEEPIFIGFINNLKLNLPVSSTVIGQNLALGIAVVIVMLWNFLVNRYWTYSDIK